MDITMAMLWNILNQKYQGLEIQMYGVHPIRGIKLLPKDHALLEDETIYLSCKNGALYLRYGRAAPEKLDTTLSLEELFNAMLDSYSRLRDWDMETHLALIEERGIQMLLELCEDIIGNPLTVMDPSFRLLARSKRHVTGSSIFAEVCRRGYLPPETVELYHLRGYFEDLIRTGQETAFPGEADSVSIIRPLYRDGKIVGYLSMPCVEHLYSEGVADCFHYLACWMEQCMARELQSKAFNRYMYEYFLQELLEGKAMQPERITERLAYIDLPLTGHFRLLKLSGVQEEPSISGYVARRLEERLPNVRVFSHQGSVLVLLFEERLAWVLDALPPLLHGAITRLRGQPGIFQPHGASGRLRTGGRRSAAGPSDWTAPHTAAPGRGVAEVR